jgi:hypothetical protein
MCTVWLGCTVHCVARLHGVSGLEFDSATHAPGSHYEYYDYQQGGGTEAAARSSKNKRLTALDSASCRLHAAACSSCTLRVTGVQAAQEPQRASETAASTILCAPPPACVAEEMAWFGTRKSHSQLKPAKMSTTNCVGRGSTLYYEEAPCTTRKHPVLH